MCATSVARLYNRNRPLPRIVNLKVLLEKLFVYRNRCERGNFESRILSERAVEGVSLPKAASICEM